jgi:hypothetical protein
MACNLGTTSAARVEEGSLWLFAPPDVCASSCWMFRKLPHGPVRIWFLWEEARCRGEGSEWARERPCQVRCPQRAGHDWRPSLRRHSWSCVPSSFPRSAVRSGRWFRGGAILSQFLGRDALLASKPSGGSAKGSAWLTSKA